MDQVDARSLWASLLAHTRELIPLRAAAIHVDRNSLVDAVRASLRNLQESRRGLEALAYLDPGFTLDLLEDVLDRAESPRDAGLAKQALGRLQRATLAQPLHDAVVRRLDRADDDQYRRLAELLRHLGLAVTLQSLVDRALQSGDRHIRGGRRGLPRSNPSLRLADCAISGQRHELPGEIEEVTGTAGGRGLQ